MKYKKHNCDKHERFHKHERFMGVGLMTLQTFDIKYH